MYWLLVLFWSSLVVKVSSNYRVVENTPDKPCTLATPEIEFGDLPNRVILDGDSLPDTWQEARVGYVKALVELQYIGCIRLRDISGIHHVSVSTSLDVGQCYSACGDDYAIIGLTSRDSDSPCLCFGDDIKSRTDRLNDCNTKCGAFVCGSHGSVSIYEKVKVELATGQHSYRSDSCLTVSVDGYNWKKCDVKLCHVACFTDNDETKYFSLSKYVCVWPFRDTWSNGVRQCFADSKYPITYQQSSSVDWKEQHWTGVIQTIAIRKSIEMVSSSTDKPGTSQSPEILSTSPSASTYADTTPPLRSSHTSTPTKITPENTSIADTSTANLITTTTTKITTAMSTENKHMTESMALPNGDKTEEESNVGLSIGLPVAALLLVGIGVVVFVLWKRRRKPLKEKETPSSLQNNVIYQNNNAMIAQTNNAYEEADKPSDVPNDQANVYDLCKDDDKNSQHDYGNSFFVLEKAKDGEEYSEVSKAREKKSEYSEVSKTRDKKTESNDNAYFVLENEEKTPDPEDTGYGSSNSGNFKSKGASNVPDRHVYSTAGSANTVGNPYDEYDHIGRSSGRALTESNLYDSTFANKPTDTTYDSTLLNTSAKRNKTDAIYDKANNAANNVYANIGDN